MTKRFSIHETSVAGIFVLERKPIADKRGFFERSYCSSELEPILGGCQIRQINRSFTREKGAARGFHFQRPPFMELKIVNCLRGRILDVAVDLRAGSPTYLQHVAVELSHDNNRSLVIPEGCAHGFQTLERDSELLYFHSADYEPGSEGGLNLKDPSINVEWPLEFSEISARDEDLPFVNDDFERLQV